MAFVRTKTQKRYNTLFVTVPTDEVSNYYIDWKRNADQLPSLIWLRFMVLHINFIFLFFLRPWYSWRVWPRVWGAKKVRPGIKYMNLLRVTDVRQSNNQAICIRHVFITILKKLNNIILGQWTALRVGNLAACMSFGAVTHIF